MNHRLIHTLSFCSTVMKVPLTGGVSQAIGPPGFGRLNDIHVHKDGTGPLGNYCVLYGSRQV